MSDFKPPGSPSYMASSKVRWFDGIGGPPDQVLSRKNDKGWDISNSICNDVVDLDLREGGTMKLRLGMGKVTGPYTESVSAIFGIRMGGRRRFGVISGGTLDVLETPLTGGVI